MSVSQLSLESWPPLGVSRWLKANGQAEIYKDIRNFHKYVFLSDFLINVWFEVELEIRKKKFKGGRKAYSKKDSHIFENLCFDKIQMDKT